MLAKLEVMLSLYWNTPTRHFLLHTFEFIVNCGHFWAFSMLGVERLHVTIKKLGKSKRNIMKSIQTRNDRTIQSQLEWRYTPDHEWTNKSRPSSFQMKKPIPEDCGIVQPKGQLRKKQVNSRVFQTLENEWAVSNNAFNRCREKYRTYVEERTTQNQTFLSFRDWQKQLKNRTPE